MSKRNAKITGSTHSRSWKMDTELGTLIAKMVLDGDIVNPTYAYYPKRKFLTLRGYSRACAEHYFAFRQETGYSSKNARLNPSLLKKFGEDGLSESELKALVKRRAGRRLTSMKKGDADYGPKFVMICRTELRRQGWKRRNPRNTLQITKTTRRGIFDEKITDTSNYWHLDEGAIFNTAMVQDYEEFRLDSAFWGDIRHSVKGLDEIIRKISSKVEQGQLTLCETCETFFTYVPQQRFCRRCSAHISKRERHKRKLAAREYRKGPKYAAWLKKRKEAK